MLRFKPALSLCSFTFIKGLFSSCSLSDIRVSPLRLEENLVIFSMNFLMPYKPELIGNRVPSCKGGCGVENLAFPGGYGREIKREARITLDCTTDKPLLLFNFYAMPTLLHEL